MKKFIFLISMLSLLFLFSCSQNEGTGENLTETDVSAEITGETSDPQYEELGEKNFEGKAVTILDSNDHPSFFQNFAEELNGDPLNDAMFNRDQFIIEKYNVELKYLQEEPAATGTQKIRNSIKAGLNDYDIIISTAQGGSLEALATENMLYNLAKAPHLSLQSPWWSKLLYDNLQYNGKLFYSMGDFSASMYGCIDCVFYNKQLMSDYGITENFYSLVNEGKWTYDVLARITKDTDRDLDGDGKVFGIGDFYGIAVQDQAICNDFMLVGAGVKYSDITDGRITVSMNNEFNIKRIEKLAEMINPQGLVGWDSIRISFFNDKALFLVHQLSSGYLELRNMQSDYGILPIPKFDEAQESYYSLVNPWGTIFTAMPSNVADPEGTAFLMEAMAYTSYKMVRPQMCGNVLKVKATRDEESEKIIDMIINTSYLDFGAIYNFGSITTMTYNAVYLKTPFVSAYEKAQAKIEADILKLQDHYTGGEN